MRRAAIALGLLAVAGCAAEPEGVAARAALDELPRSVWERAPAGCEEAALDPALHLAAVEGEPALGALVDPGGAPRCVDALFVLRWERGLTDPTPTPMLPE